MISETLIESFDDFANWALGGSGGNIAADPVHGGLQLNITNAGGSLWAQKVVSYNFGQAENQNFRLWVYLPDDPGNYSSISVCFAITSGWMRYIDKNYYYNSLAQGWNCFTFRFDDFIKSGDPLPTINDVFVRMRVQMIAATGLTCSATFTDLYYNAEMQPLVVLTADDNPATLMAALPILRAFGCHATAFTTPGYVNTANHMTLPQLHEWHDAGNDVSSHGSYNHQNLTLKSLEEAQADIESVRDWLIAHGFTRDDEHKHLAYPFGATNANVKQATINAGGLTGRGYVNGVFHWPPMLGEYYLRCYELSTAMTLSAAQAIVDEAKLRQGIVVFFGHNFDHSAGDPNRWEADDLHALLAYCYASNVPVVSMTELYAAANF